MTVDVECFGWVDHTSLTKEETVGRGAANHEEMSVTPVEKWVVGSIFTSRISHQT